jgi:hypothetical protein
MVYIDNQIITLNSKDSVKKNGTSNSNVLFNFKALLKDEPNVVRSYIKVANAQIPVSFYMIDATNNKLSYALSVLLIQYSVTIPIGNYNVNTLIATLITLFTANGTTITPTFNLTTGKLTFTSTLNYIYYPNGTNGCTFGNILGVGTSSIVGNNITFPFPLNLVTNKKLYVNSSYLHTTAYTSLNFGFSTTICTIPVNQPSYNVINYVSITDTDKIIITNKHLEQIDIQITDEDSNLINFNNSEWSITLCLSCEKIDFKKQYLSDFEKYGMDYIPEQLIEPTQDEKDLEFLEK